MNQTARKIRWRYWLACFLEDMNEGQKFTPGEMHLTILPWFVIEITEAKLLKSFEENFSKYKAINIQIDGRENFGPNKDVPVNLINDNLAVISLHNHALQWFSNIGARWSVKNPHSGVDFRAHIREGKMELKPGDKLKLKSLSLVKANRREDNVRTIAGKVEFVQ